MSLAAHTGIDLIVITIIVVIVGAVCTIVFG